MNKTKEKILNVSLALFMEKGFDATSISDILDKLDIARGTLYYHFESKESIMDAIIERLISIVINKIQNIIDDDKLSVYDKLFSAFGSMNTRVLTGYENIADYLNRPQNALFHEKSNQMMYEKLSPLLSKIIQQGIQEKLFINSYPDEASELILILLNGFVNESSFELPMDVLQKRLDALTYNVEKILSAKEGSFSIFKELVNG